MQEQSQFSIQLRKYLAMVINIWPSLRAGSRHLTDITGPHQQSPIPQRSYRTMTQQMFFQTIINDLHQFIMQHDVKQEDIQDYFRDILDMLNIDQDLSLIGGNKVGSVRYMSYEVINVIKDLQQGRTLLVDNFQNNVYNVVLQMGVGDAIRQGGDSSSDEQQQDGDDEMDEQKQGYQSEDDEWDQQGSYEQQQQNGQKDKQGQEQQMKKQQQQQLQDDGWVIVKKKK